eukprot:2255616-Ditylum_brightwellii.AAC.2
MSMQLEYAEKANALRKEALERKKNKEETKEEWLGELYKTTLNMLIMASAKDCNDTPSNPAESCSLFFNCNNAALADQELHR